MGVYIKGMEMPQCCGDCHIGFCKQIGCELYIGFDNYATSRHPNCPLGDVSTPHGDLIDRDALPTSRVEWEDIVNAPTVIEAEKGD